MQTEYRLVFDVADASLIAGAGAPSVWVLPAAGLLMVIVGHVAKPGSRARKWRPFAWFYFLFASMVCVIWLWSHFAEARGLKSALATGQVEVSEGCLEAFHPMPEGGHSQERLRLDGRVFEYSDFSSTAAFNNTEAHGGPVHADSRLRITSAGDKIVRLEVQDHACPAAPDFSAAPISGDR